MEPFVFVAEQDIPDLGVVAGDHVAVAPWRKEWLGIHRIARPNPGLILNLCADGRLRHLTPDRPLDALAQAVGSDLVPPPPPSGSPRRRRGRRPPYLHRVK